MKVTIALTVALIGFVTFSAALEAYQKNVRTTYKDDGIAMKDEGKIDVINKIQLEDQVFWARTMSMSTFIEGDSSYSSSGACTSCSSSCYCCGCNAWMKSGSEPQWICCESGYVRRTFR